MSFGFPRRSFEAKAFAPVDVNWRRGLFRVWLLFSAAWLMGWSIYLTIFGIQGGFKQSDEYFAIPVLLLGPPVALLLFGLATRWAAHGFKPNAGPPDAA